MFPTVRCWVDRPCPSDHRRARRAGQACPSRKRGCQAWRGCYPTRVAMPFIPPMLATRLEDPRRLADPRYIAGPKLDRQRAQLHVRNHRTVHALSRPGRELIRLPGLAWLREIRWPVASTVLDGEAVAGDGGQGIQAVFEARHRPGCPMVFAAFDVLELDGQSGMDQDFYGAGIR